MQDETNGRHGRSRVRAIAKGIDRPWQRPYDRERDLPRLVPVLAADLRSDDHLGHRQIVRLLRRALRAERARAREGHWTYNPARHAALVRACKLEAAGLRAAERRRAARDARG
jgi:hypothetical protein